MSRSSGAPPPGGGVPNERDDKGTVEVDVQLPPGFEFVSYEPVAGWKAQVRREGEQVRRITWTGGVIEPGQFRDFGLSVGIPDGNPGDALTFKALQTYEGGEVVRWIGPPDAEAPAPVVTLTAPDGEAAAPEPETTPTPAAAAGEDDDGGSDGLAIAALAVGALGLLAGVSALAAARRRTA